MRLFTDPSLFSLSTSLAFKSNALCNGLTQQHSIMEFSRSYLVSLVSRRVWKPTGRIKARQFARCVATHTHSFHADQISVIRSTVDTSSPEFKENEKQMKDAIAKIRELSSTISQGGSAKAREKHVSRGKMLAREYVYLPNNETRILTALDNTVV
jgi:hypothetical protein